LNDDVVALKSNLHRMRFTGFTIEKNRINHSRAKGVIE
jgi:hypothetical protein